MGNNYKFQNVPKELQNLAKDTLNFIKTQNGKWFWYQLDRSLSHDNNLPHMSKLIQILKQLEANNLISSDDSESTSQPTYSITEHGEKLLSSNKVDSQSLIKSDSLS